MSRRAKANTIKLIPTVFLIISLVLGFMLGTILYSSQAPESVANAQTVSYYKGVKVSQGESLESLAVQYNDSNIMSDDEYIELITRINNLTDDRIHPGCYITVAYFN